MNSNSLGYQKIIFSGGFPTKAADGGIGFCKEILEGAFDTPKILECIFGMSDGSRENSMKKDEELFRKFFPGRAIEFKLARPENFIPQINNADVIYFRGGETSKLHSELSKIPGWQEAVKGKIIVGASAGAYVLSDYYIQFNEDAPTLEKGFGLVPVKIVAHYLSTFRHQGNLKAAEKYWKQVDEIMQNARQDLDSVKLKEGEFKVI